MAQIRQFQWIGKKILLCVLKILSKRILIIFALIFNLNLNPMEKEFNVTGTCFPDRHYMADVSHKMTDTLLLVEKGL
jgi:hypothetical protein